VRGGNLVQIKASDGRANDIVVLERLLERPDVPLATRKLIEAEIRQVKAGERAERDAAYQIELYFGQSESWATIHDLRFEVDGLAAQIDHLIVNRLAEVWVCESKAFAEGVSINDHGEWSRWRHGRQEGMASPIEQNRRHIHLLERAFDLRLAPLPRRLGLVPMKPRLRSLVLVSNEARISRPRRKVDALDEVIKAEQLKTRLFDEFDRVSTLDISRIIGKEGLEQFAQGMAALHRPATFDWVARFGLAPAPIPGCAGSLRLAGTFRRPASEAPATMARQVRRTMLDLRANAGKGHAGDLGQRASQDVLPGVRTGLSRPDRRGS
jgi:hypothetical protein